MSGKKLSKLIIAILMALLAFGSCGLWAFSYFVCPQYENQSDWLVAVPVMGAAGAIVTFAFFWRSTDRTLKAVAAVVIVIVLPIWGFCTLPRCG